MQFHYEIVDTPLGKFFILDSKDGLHYVLRDNDSRIKTLIQTYLPVKKLFNKSIVNYLKSCIEGKYISKKLKLNFLNGTELQRKVWNQILKISVGNTSSYSKLAFKLKRPKAIRAVASAVGKNPISVIIPCHRVIRKNGSLGGYAWGLSMKIKLLDIEVSGMADSIYRGGK